MQCAILLLHNALFYDIIYNVKGEAMKKSVILFLSVLACVCVAACLTGCGGNDEAGKYELSKDGSYYTLTEYVVPESGEVVTPSNYNGKPVKKIERDLFKGNTGKLKTLVVSEGIEELCGYAFSTCYNLEKVTLPSSLKTIGKNAFAGCEVLETITLPDGVEAVGENVFDGCKNLKTISLGKNLGEFTGRAFANTKNLTEIKVDENNARFKVKDGAIYSADEKVLVAVTAIKTESFVLPAQTTEIGEFAFYKRSGVKGVELSASTEKIGDYAFYGSGIKSANLPDKVTSIGTEAFSWCASLKSVTFGSGLLQTGINSFRNCAALTAINFCDKNTLKTISEGSFEECVSLESVNVPDGVTRIELRAFNNCTKLSTVAIGKDVEIICGTLYGTTPAEEKPIGAFTKDELHGKNTVKLRVDLARQDYWSLTTATTCGPQLRVYQSKKYNFGYKIPHGNGYESTPYFKTSDADAVGDWLSRNPFNFVWVNPETYTFNETKDVPSPQGYDFIDYNLKENRR